MRICNVCGGEVEYINNQTVKCKYCGKLYSVNGDMLSDANSENIYREASNLALAAGESNAHAAISLFEALGSYKDSASKAAECKRKIEQDRVAAEDRRLEEQRRAELEEIERKKREYQEKQKKKVITITGASVAIVCIIVIAIMGSAHIRKQSRYNEAVALYGQEKYEDALPIFEGLENYSDSADYVSNINRLITDREEVYGRAKNYYDNKQYGNAIQEFLKYPSYLDSQEYVNQASEKIFEEAKASFESEEIKKAQELLMTIPQGTSAYNDALVLLTEVNAAVQEQENAQKYAQAMEALNNEQHDSAQELFLALGDYQDAKTYLSDIGNWYYGQAQAAYDAGDYPLCGDVVERIDTPEEWEQYDRAVILKTSAKEQYQNDMREEGKNICRNQGYDEMIKYINQSICSILSAEDANVLKEECTIKSVALADINAYITSNNIKWVTATDNMGNDYSRALEGRGYIKFDNSSVWSIDGKYKYLTATIAIKEYWREYAEGVIRIWGDDRLLWQDEGLNQTTKPYNITVDITNVIDLKIEMYSEDGYSAVLMCNVTLTE